MQVSTRERSCKAKKKDAAETSASSGTSRSQKRPSRTRSRRPRSQSASKMGVWTEEEHHKLIDAIKKYGRKWPSIQHVIPDRTPMQLRTHGQKLFRKVGKVCPENIDIIDFIKSKPTSWFFKSVSGCAFSHMPRADSKSRGVSRPATKEDNPKARIQATAKKPSGGARRPARVRNANTKSKAVQPPRVVAPAPELPTRSKKVELAVEKPSTLESIIEVVPAAGSQHNPSLFPDANKLEETKAASGAKASAQATPQSSSNPGDNPSGNPSGKLSGSGNGKTNPLWEVQPPAVCILPPGEIHHSLKKLLNDLGNFSYRLEADYSERRIQLDADTLIAPYWRALADCAMSLEHMANDILILHQHAERNSSPLLYSGPAPMRYPFRQREIPPRLDESPLAIANCVQPNVNLLP